MERHERILDSIDRSMRILELGPLHEPVASKKDGWDTCVVDHGTREELAEKYRDDSNVDIEAIENVDVVWSDGALHEALAPEQLGTFDACIASHVLEHLPDPIGLFRSLEVALRPDGVVSLAVPDKRFCFDYFKSLSTVGDLLAARERRATRHSAKSHFDYLAYNATNRGKICWSRANGDDLALSGSIDQAKRAFDAHLGEDTSEYIDMHAWHFTPSSFRLAIFELAALKEIDLHVDRTLPPLGCEFFVQLRRGRRVPDSPQEVNDRRLELLKSALREVGEQAELLGSGARQGRMIRPRLAARVREAKGRLRRAG